MKEHPVFLSVDHVIAIHRRVIEEFGGSGEVRDRGLLESAVMLPAAQFRDEYLHRGLPEMAAAYLFGICRNHAFVDGNKRTALVAAEVFLMLNGMELKATNAELAEVTFGVAAGEVTKDEITRFMRKRVHRGRW
jgi:death on curing protein